MCVCGERERGGVSAFVCVCVERERERIKLTKAMFQMQINLFNRLIKHHTSVYDKLAVCSQQIRYSYCLTYFQFIQQCTLTLRPLSLAPQAYPSLECMVPKCTQNVHIIIIAHTHLLFDSLLLTHLYTIQHTAHSRCMIHI